MTSFSGKIVLILDRFRNFGGPQDVGYQPRHGMGPRPGFFHPGQIEQAFDNGGGPVDGNLGNGRPFQRPQGLGPVEGCGCAVPEFVQNVLQIVREILVVVHHEDVDGCRVPRRNSILSLRAPSLFRFN